MPFYHAIKKFPSEDRERTIQGIQNLRSQKAKLPLPTRTLKKTLLLATWNIRDFGNEDKRAKDGLDQPGPRLPESYYYIAEIISAFDIVAIQEVNKLDALERLMRILGPNWEYMTTDINPGRGGNEERMTFVYDTRKVRFQHIAGQIVTDKRQQFVRTPYYAAFQSGWFKFSLCTVHILYGDFKDLSERIGEIDEIASFLSKRASRTDENIILLGDFNILSRDDETFEPLNRHGWDVPLDFRTNVAKNKSYDQIAFKVKEGVLQRGQSNPNAGAFDFFESVFKTKDWEKYYEIAKATGRPMTSWDKSVHWKTKKKLTRAQYFEQWRTWQISDHLPLWLELKIDFTDHYLNKIGG
jgi:endonuclease/exonuclease/phosphatase family metal-dependent hydrolase